MENEKSPEIKEKAKNNRTLTLSNEEIAAFSENLITKDDIETLSSPDVQGAEIVTEPIEIFPYLIALLIILLIIEWGVYYREQY